MSRMIIRSKPPRWSPRPPRPSAGCTRAAPGTSLPASPSKRGCPMPEFTKEQIAAMPEAWEVVGAYYVGPSDMEPEREHYTTLAEAKKRKRRLHRRVHIYGRPA